MKMIALVCIFLFAHALARENVTCPENQEYVTCGTACPLTCDNFNNPPNLCTLQCVEGCACKDGFVEGNNGTCVLPRDCPSHTAKQCVKSHEVYSECGSACEPTCALPFPRICTAQCVSGCFCEPLYLRDAHGDCVFSYNCTDDEYGSQQCTKPHEKFEKCASACQPTCKEPNPQVCTKQCVIGCVCETGYFLNDEGDCVEPQNCPPLNSTQLRKSNNCVNNTDCPDLINPIGARSCNHTNEGYISCGSACEPSCETPKPEICTEQCIAGCFCKAGYFRHANGKCVRLNKCEQFKQNKTDGSSSSSESNEAQ